MDRDKCIKCGEEDALKGYSFLTVNVNSSSITSGRTTTTTTTESLTGMASCAVCSDCIRKKRISYAIVCGVGALIGVFVAVILFGGFFIGSSYYNDHFPGVVLFALAAGAVAAIIALIVTLQKEDPFVAAMLKKAADKKRDSSAAHLNYVPTDSSLYVDKKTNTLELAVFTRKTGLRTALAATLFVIVLAGVSDAK